MISPSVTPRRWALSLFESLPPETDHLSLEISGTFYIFPVERGNLKKVFMEEVVPLIGKNPCTLCAKAELRQIFQRSLNSVTSPRSLTT
jgi:hypothetical protein